MSSVGLFSLELSGVTKKDVKGQRTVCLGVRPEFSEKFKTLRALLQKL